MDHVSGSEDLSKMIAIDELLKSGENINKHFVLQLEGALNFVEHER